MKNFVYPLILGLLALFTFAIDAKAQCISKYPYEQNFEDFDSIQEVQSCNTAVLGDTANGWLQDQNDGAEWRADTSGTPSTGTGPGATLTTSGMGVGKDFKPGTLGGHYMYIEASAPSNSCANTVANLISPCFDFSGGKAHRLNFAYHMFGAQMGTLSVDVYDSSKWITDVWSKKGDQGTSWHSASISLPQFSKSNTRIRLRFTIGLDFRSDIAIDHFMIEEYTAPAVDLLLLSANSTDSNFFRIPFSQTDSIAFSVNVLNQGIKTANSVKTHVSNGNWSDSAMVGNISAFATSYSLSPNLTTWHTGLTDTFKVEVKATEADGNILNNSASIITHFNDSILSIDHDSLHGGIGFNTGVGQIGQAFTLRHKDTLTSISFYSNNTVSGDSVRVHLMTFGANGPDTILQTMEGIVLRGAAGWYNVRLNCETILNARSYFVAIEQLVNNSNIAIGYWNGKYVKNSAMYNGGAAWIDLGTAGFESVLLIRLNFGRTVFPNAEINLSGADTVCFGQLVTMAAKGKGSYLWSPSSIIPNNKSQIVSALAKSSFTATLRVTNKCMWYSESSQSVYVKPTPSGWTSPDTIACLNDEIILRAGGGDSYTWAGGPSNRSWKYKVTGDKVVQVVIDSSNGCKRTYNINVGSSVPTVIASNDTSICEGNVLKITADGAGSYQWVNGPTTPEWSVRPFNSTTYIVEGFNALGCNAFDTVKVTTMAGPSIESSNDTAVCFGQRVDLSASGGVSYQWIDGPATEKYNVLPISTKHYYVEVEGTNGCKLTDSIHVRVEKRPNIKLSNDTTICEGQGVRLVVISNDDVNFVWSNGTTGKVLNISPKESATYTMNAANDIGCFSEDSVRVDVDPLPNAGFTYTLKARDVTLTNTSTNGNSYSWDFGDGDQSSDKNSFHRYAIDGDYNVVLTVSNNCGDDDTSILIKIENLSVKDFDLELLKVAPNPAHNWVKVSFENAESGDVSLNIFDLNGSLLLSESYLKVQDDFSEVINLPQLSKGVYLIEIQQKGHRGTARLMVE